MKLPNLRRAAAAGGTALGLLVFAPAALADSITYAVPTSPAYTIQDNGTGIVKVTYNGCVTTGARQTFAFQTTTEVNGGSQNAGTATFSVLREEGEAPQATFNPATLTLVPGPPQTASVTLSYTLNNENNGVTTFRIKLDPASGQGLGQGAGIMVSIPCVIQSQSIPSVTSRGAAAAAPCVAVRAVRLRAGRSNRVVVNVRSGGQEVIGSRVRVTGPGVRQTKSTNGLGQAVFIVRPRRAGTLFVQSDVCAGADRLAVRPAAINLTG